MKTAAFISWLASAAMAGTPVLPPVKPAELARLQALDPMARFERPAAPAPAAAQSIIRQSTLLHDGRGHWTMVPAGALVHVPEALRPRVVQAPAGSLLPWLDFLALNRTWLTTTEVSLEQAAGQQGLPAERSEFWLKQDKIVVAVHRGGPISLRSHPTPLASNNR